MPETLDDEKIASVRPDEKTRVMNDADHEWNELLDIILEGVREEERRIGLMCLKLDIDGGSDYPTLYL